MLGVDNVQEPHGDVHVGSDKFIDDDDEHRLVIVEPHENGSIKSIDSGLGREDGLHGWASSPDPEKSQTAEQKHMARSLEFVVAHLRQSRDSSRSPDSYNSEGIHSSNSSDHNNEVANDEHFSEKYSEHYNAGSPSKLPTNNSPEVLDKIRTQITNYSQPEDASPVTSPRPPSVTDSDSDNHIDVVGTDSDAFSLSTGSSLLSSDSDSLKSLSTASSVPQNIPYPLQTPQTLPMGMPLGMPHVPYGGMMMPGGMMPGYPANMMGMPGLPMMNPMMNPFQAAAAASMLSNAQLTMSTALKNPISSVMPMPQHNSVKLEQKPLKHEQSSPEPVNYSATPSVDENQPLDLTMPSRKRRLSENGPIDTPERGIDLSQSFKKRCDDFQGPYTNGNNLAPNIKNGTHSPPTAPAPVSFAPSIPRSSPVAQAPTVSPPLVQAPNGMPTADPRNFTNQAQLKAATVVEYQTVKREIQSALSCSSRETKDEIEKLRMHFEGAVEALELARMDALKNGKGRKQKQMVNQQFDFQRLNMTRYTRFVLASEKTRLGIQDDVKPAAPVSSAQTSFNPALTNGYINITPENNVSNFPSALPKLSSAVPEMSPVKDDAPKKKRVFLSPHAICTLSSWYEEHHDHPYPSDIEVETLANKAQITISQVRKWFANKRVRSCNTLAFNGSVHPKKLQKLRQLKNGTSPPSASQVQEYSQFTLETNLKQVDSEDGGQNSPPSQRSPDDLNTRSPDSDSVLDNSDGLSSASKRKSKRFLNPKAVEMMKTWYNDHLEYPYPTEEEKEDIANATGVTVGQITCWFANKRNRSNNTKRLTSTQGFHGSPNHMSASPHQMGMYGMLPQGAGYESSPSMVPRIVPYYNTPEKVAPLHTLHNSSPYSFKTEPQ